MNKREVLNDIVLFLIPWGTVFFGILIVTTLPIFTRELICLADTITIFVSGVIYFNYERLKEKLGRKFKLNHHPIIITIENKERIVLLIVIGELFDTALSFYAGFKNWYVLTINKIPVVTYGNMLCIAFFIAGLAFAADAGGRLGKRSKEKRKKREADIVVTIPNSFSSRLF
jgi:hypothetical protein